MEMIHVQYKRAQSWITNNQENKNDLRAKLELLIVYIALKGISY